MAKKTILDFENMKKTGEPLTWLVLYDACFASYAEDAGLDMILVGDSMGMIVYGEDTTTSVTMDQEIYHCQGVRKGAPNTFILGDMPFGSYHVSNEDAVNNAVRFIKEGYADGVKLEGGVKVANRIKAIVDAGIVVCGHVGLTPQSSASLGGHKVQGKNAEMAKLVIDDAIAVYEAGARMLLLEAVPEEVASYIRKKLPIPVYGIGAGSDCDGQCVLVADIVGMYKNFTPKFVKKYAEIGQIATDAISEYIKEVHEREFPFPENKYKFTGDLEELDALFKEYDLKMDF